MSATRREPGTARHGKEVGKVPELRSIEDRPARTEPSTSTWKRPRVTDERHHVRTDDTEGNGRRFPEHGVGPAEADDTEGNRRRYRK